MTKINISRIFEISQALATEPGQALSNFIRYTADFAEQTIRALRNGLTFADNFNCLVSTVSLQHDTAQIVNTGGKTPIGVIPIRTISTATAVESVTWYIDDSSQLVVKASFSGAPSGIITTNLVILF